MLKSFFTREPSVKVRHRFFSDEKGMQKWLQEVAYLAEPVVISLSTHGSEEGASVNGKNIGAKAIAESLRYAGNVRLLHFSACCMMKGKIAAEIHTASSQTAQFPISGYTTAVEWAGSAVLEFMYFDLILSRHMPPEKAVEQVKKLMPFAGDKKIEGAIISSADLRIALPPEKKNPSAGNSKSEIRNPK